MKIKGYCRVCTGRNSDLMSIFEVCKFSECNLQIFEVITKCASVQIQKLDGCPEQICKRCTEHLCQAFNFKQLCEDSDYKFRHNLIDGYKTDANCDDVSKAYETIDENIFTEGLNCMPSIDDEFETKIEFCEEDTKIQFGIIPEENIKKPTINFTRLQNITGLIASLETKRNSEQTVIPCTEVKSEIEDENEARDISTFVRIDIKSEFNAEETKMQYGVLENQSHEKESSTDLSEELSGSSQNTEVSNQKPHISEKIQLNKHEEEFNTTFNDCGIIGPTQKLYICKTCGKCFKNNGRLVEHERCHTGEKPYKCETCNKCFSRKGHLNYHKRVHTGEKPHKCGTCSKCFICASALRRHKWIHISEKPYKCETCNKCFSDERYLKYHKRVHTREKPHKCETCSKCFNCPSALSRHKWIHVSEEKPYKCETCNNCFSKEVDLNSHNRLVHLCFRDYNLRIHKSIHVKK